MLGVGVATWTVDRGVERDGLIFVRWELGGTPIDSYLRSDDPPALLAALNGIETTPTDSAAHDSAPQESEDHT